MDGLGATASIIATIQIAQMVGKALKEYYQGVRDAREDIKELYSAVKSLEIVLLELDKLAKSQSIDAAILHSANGALQLCKADLKGLEELLGFPTEFQGKIAKSMHYLKWPMKKNDATKMVRTIERHKSTLTLDIGVRNLASNLEHFDILKDIRSAVAEAQETNERLAVVRWLSIADPSKEHHVAREKHEPPTGSWLVTGNEFKAWLASENSLLWLTAGAGAGKSILCSTVIVTVQELCKPEINYAVAYWYFTFTDEQKQNVSNFLASIIVQLLSQRASIPKVILDAYAESMFGTHRPSIASLQTMLQSVIEGYESVFIVVDALDECPRMDGSREKLLEKLQEILAWNTDVLHTFLTSRKETDIEAAILQSTEFVRNHQFLAPEGSRVEADIQVFLSSRLKSPQFNKWPEKLKQEANLVLSERGQGMFRLVALQLDELGRMARLSPKSIQAALHQLPRTLDAFYDRMLLSIDELHVEMALLALQWLAFSARPLKLSELAEAMIILSADDFVLDPEERFMEDFAVLDILPAGLVNVHNIRDEDASDRDTGGPVPTEDNKSEDLPGYDNVSIQFSHFSVKEYLLSSRLADNSAASFRLDEVASHNTIAASCVSYLLHLLGEAELPHPNADAQDLQNYRSYVAQEFKLFDYAFTQWPYHLDRLGQDASPLVTKATFRLLSKETTSLESWQALMANYSDQVARFRWMRGTFGPTEMEQNLLALEAESPIAYALWLGLPQLAIRLIELSQTWEEAWSGHDLDAEIPTRCLMRATQNGWGSVVKILLERGVPPDAELRENPGRHALHFAVAYRRYDTLKLLLDAGADINASFDGESALRLAVTHRSSQLTKLLLSAGADPNVAKVGALYLVAAIGQVDIAKMLIEAGANVNINNDKPELRGPLYYAAIQGGAPMVLLLLSAGTDIRSQHNTQSRILEVLRQKKMDFSQFFDQAVDSLWEIVKWQKSHDLKVPDEVENIFGGQFWEKWASSDTAQKEVLLGENGLWVWKPGRPVGEVTRT